MTRGGRQSGHGFLNVNPFMWRFASLSCALGFPVIRRLITPLVFLTGPNRVSLR